MNGSGKMKNGGSNGGKGRGRPKKLAFFSVASRKLGRNLTTGHQVVVRRNDGLLYRGEVLRVEEANDRCQIKFNEGLTLYTLYKDIHKVPGDGEDSCCVCNGESSEQTNPIVFCDSCGFGYHRSCHNPPILSAFIFSSAKFFCKLCTFAATVKHAGSPRLNMAVSAYEDDVRQVLPYKKNLLTWDAQHRTNVEQSYCYCGGPGDWHCKMLQCCRCRQWFHEACIQCLEHPLLYGDGFFMFVCSHCNQGHEYIKRLPFRWVDVVQLALYNLTLNFTHKYYDLDHILLPWIAEQQDNLAIDNLLEGKSVNSVEVRNKVEAALVGHRSKFTSGREVKKKYTLWALILRVPPNAPSVVVPLSGPINDDVLNNPAVKGRKTKHILPIQCQSPVPLKYLSRYSLDPRLSIMFKTAVTGNLFAETNNNGLPSKYKTGQCQNGTSNGLHSNGLTNGHSNSHSNSHTNSHSNCHTNGHSNSHSNGLTNGHLPSSSEESSEDEDRVASCIKKKVSVKAEPPAPKTTHTVCKMVPQTSPAQRDRPPLPSPKPRPSSLDVLVKRPPSFQGRHHPFRTEMEKEVERQQLKHFETRMLYLKKEYAGELAAFKLAQDIELGAAPQEKLCVIPQEKPVLIKTEPVSPEPKHRRGVKRKQAEVDPSPSDSVRRSKRSRMNAERYQHLLDSFPRHMPKPDPDEVPIQRWRWKSVVDQLRYGEKFQVHAWRLTPGATIDFLLHWEEED